MLRSIFCCVLMASGAAAQDRSGADTAGEWVVTHQTRIGGWDSMCDERTTGDTLEQRCYVRYVDVYAPRPNFGALFLFVTADGVEFGMERGIRFGVTGPRITRGGKDVWQENRFGCRRGWTCKLGPADAQAFLDIAADSDALAFTFTDRDDRPQDLNWDLSEFAEVLSDWRAQSQARDLPHL